MQNPDKSCFSYIADHLKSMFIPYRRYSELYNMEGSTPISKSGVKMAWAYQVNLVGRARDLMQKQMRRNELHKLGGGGTLNTKATRVPAM